MTLKNLVLLAGLACAASAFANPDVAQPTRLPAGLPVKHMYYNLATGEMVETGVVSRSPVVWGDAVSYSGYYFPSDRGDGTGSMQGDRHWDEGMLATNAAIDGFDFTYWAGGATVCGNPASTGDLNMSFADTYTICGGVQPNVINYTIAGLPMDGCVAYIFHIDVTGIGFNLIGGSLFSFNWSWNLANAPTASNLGMYMVNLDPVNAPGGEDVWLSTGPVSPGCWYFGGPPNPPAQFHMTLYGVAGGGGCPADFNGDTAVDFFDYDDFVNCFEGVVCPPGKDADFNNDTAVDFFDYDDFVVAFETPC